MSGLESVQAATDHARLIAARIAKGVNDPYAAVPWFWSDQGDKKLQIAGFAGPEATEEVVSPTASWHAGRQRALRPSRRSTRQAFT